MSDLRTIDVTANTEKKGKFSYLSWAWAVDKLIETYPDATWDVKKFPMMVWDTTGYTDAMAGYTNDAGEVTPPVPAKEIKHLRAVPEMQVPYMRTDTGYYVEVGVTVNGVERTQVHPVLNHQNKPIAKPNTFEINTAIQRALAKAIALHGLGLYIYAGEDLPPSEPHRFKPKEREQIETQMREHLKNGDHDGVKEIHDEYTSGDPEEAMKFWALFSSTERTAIKNMIGDKAA